MENSVITLETSPTTAALDEALSKAQGEIEAADKDKVNPAFRSKYADLTSVWNACRAPLAKHSIAVTQWPLSSVDGRLHIITRLAHKGEWMQARFSLPLDKTNAHGVGSAITYAKRFTLSAALGIVADDDDDGNAAVASGGASRPPGRSQSSENGRRMASDDQHLVDQNRTKGTMAAGNGDALRLEPHQEPAKKLSPTESKVKTWNEQAIGTLNLSEQSKDSLSSFWKENSTKIEWMEQNMPAEYEKLLSVFDLAMERAAARAS